MIQALNNVEVITLFVDGIHRVRTFYEEVFGLEATFEDEVSAVFRIRGLMLNLLEASQAHTLVEPATVANRGTGPRFMFTIAVDDADAVCAELRAHGVALLNGPIDRPWGRRTAAFADPAGNVWEIAQVIPPA
jgi:catechol 2,3-dioxygenase-like lactoylglutathione lyase family enzyme